MIVYSDIGIEIENLKRLWVYKVFTNNNSRLFSSVLRASRLALPLVGEPLSGEEPDRQRVFIV
ncbi:hypothetical protein DIKCMJMK_03399 [Shewanella oneidensis]|nr:hypothetical protein [Shewanella oneidensis]